MSKQGIYKIVSPTGKIYIGQSIDIEKRWSRYMNLCSGVKRQPILFKSLSKHLPDNHLFTIVEACDFDMLNERERFWQEYYQCVGVNGLNCVYVNTKDKKLVRSAETRKRNAAANIGRKLSAESRAKMSKARQGQGKGRVKSEQERINISNGGKGRIFTEEHRKNISLSRAGIVNQIHQMHTPEARERNRQAKLGKKMGEENNFSKPILNLETGIFYGCYREVAESLSIKYTPHHIGKMIRGVRKNSTSFVL